MTQAYYEGFRKTAEEYGVDSTALIKFALNPKAVSMVPKAVVTVSKALKNIKRLIKSTKQDIAGQSRFIRSFARDADGQLFRYDRDWRRIYDNAEGAYAEARGTRAELRDMLKVLLADKKSVPKVWPKAK